MSALGPKVAILVGGILLFGLVNLPSVGSWTLLGTRLTSLLSNRRRQRGFNVAMATLLLASLAPPLLSA